MTWEWGFIGGPITTEEDPEGQSDFNSGYHSAETEIITDSEDDLFFLDGESATTYPCKQIIFNNKVQDQSNYIYRSVAQWPG